MPISPGLPPIPAGNHLYYDPPKISEDAALLEKRLHSEGGPPIRSPVCYYSPVR